jgi:hypothetical protein
VNLVLGKIYAMKSQKKILEKLGLKFQSIALIKNNITPVRGNLFKAISDKTACCWTNGHCMLLD